MSFSKVKVSIGPGRASVVYNMCSAMFMVIIYDTY